MRKQTICVSDAIQAVEPKNSWNLESSESERGGNILSME